MLNSVLDIESWLPQASNSSVAVIKGGFQAPIFSNLFVSRISNILDKQLIKLDSKELGLADIKASLELSFLGQSLCYWIKNIHELNNSAQKELQNFISAYKGPHKLIYLPDINQESFWNNINSKNIFIITLPSNITISDYKSLYAFVNNLTPEDIALYEPLFKILFSYQKQFKLDDAFMLCHYQATTGKGIKSFINDWLNRIIVPERSLFMLSQYFFAKDIKNFLAMWRELTTLYPEEFWVSYWADQLWQASLFLQSMQFANTSSASSTTLNARSFRLPFSFTQRDWKKYSMGECANAHNFLYNIDYRLKNGLAASESLGLELFCLKFMKSCFKK